MIADQSDAHSPLNCRMPTGSVFRSGAVSIKSASTNSFQTDTVWKIAALATTGPDSGTTIRKNTPIRLQPSSLAASSNSFGKSKKKA